MTWRVQSLILEVLLVTATGISQEQGQRDRFWLLRIKERRATEKME